MRTFTFHASGDAEKGAWEWECNFAILCGGGISYDRRSKQRQGTWLAPVAGIREQGNWEPQGAAWLAMCVVSDVPVAV